MYLIRTYTLHVHVPYTYLVHAPEKRVPGITVPGIHVPYMCLAFLHVPGIHWRWKLSEDLLITEQFSTGSGVTKQI